MVFELATASCGPAASEPAETPSGRNGFKVTCVKTDDLSYCVDEATKRCGPHYAVEHAEEGSGPHGEPILEWTISCR